VPGAQFGLVAPVIGAAFDGAMQFSQSLLEMATNTYDAAWRLSQVVDGYATTGYQYDNAGHLLETDDNAGGTSRKTMRTYDALGRLVAYTDELGDSFGCAYDMAGNLKALTYPGGKVISYSYDANNRLST
jgi:YD repeat-containing protein